MPYSDSTDAASLSPKEAPQFIWTASSLPLQRITLESKTPNRTDLAKEIHYVEKITANSFNHGFQFNITTNKGTITLQPLTQSPYLAGAGLDGRFAELKKNTGLTGEKLTEFIKDSDHDIIEKAFALGISHGKTVTYDREKGMIAVPLEISKEFLTQFFYMIHNTPSIYTDKHDQWTGMFAFSNLDTGGVSRGGGSTTESKYFYVLSKEAVQAYAITRRNVYDVDFETGDESNSVTVEGSYDTRETCLRSNSDQIITLYFHPELLSHGADLAEYIGRERNDSENSLSQKIYFRDPASDEGLFPDQCFALNYLTAMPVTRVTGEMAGEELIGFTGFDW
jgi:hypothetical protein